MKIGWRISEYMILQEWPEDIHIFIPAIWISAISCWSLWEWALDEPAVYVFKSAASVPKGDIIGYYSVYREEDILNCSFGRQQVKQAGRRYDIVKGGQAFYHKLLQEMRAEMMDA